MKLKIFSFILVFSISTTYAREFPCNLEALSNNSPLPRIVISGELHGNNYCELDEEYRRKQALSGRYYLGVEGYFASFDEKNARIFGCEDELPYALATFITYYSSITIENVKSPAKNDTKIKEFFVEFSNSSILKSIWT